MDLNTLGTHLERALMDRRRAVVFHAVGALVLSVFVTGCTPAPTEEDHPYYLDWRDTKDALQRVIEAREDNLFIFPAQSASAWSLGRSSIGAVVGVYAHDHGGTGVDRAVRAGPTGLPSRVLLT